jgi:hypothetical protein
MGVLGMVVLIAYYVLTGLYILLATCVATACLAAVSCVVLRGLARDTIDAITYGT